MNDVSILVVDDDPKTRDLLALGLETSGCRVAVASSGENALTMVRTTHYDLVLTDVQMSGMSGLDLCRVLREEHAHIPVIVMTGHATMQVAVESLREGAHDFLIKPIGLPALEHHVGRAVEMSRLRAEVACLRQTVGRAKANGKMLGDSPALRDALDLIERVARTDVSVLLSGESGTGKEVAALMLHTSSDRAAKPFVAINCAALPENLLESELFGHVRGAFTDAKLARDGLFVEANGGTLLLDEIGELPLAMQAKLLRALQERCVRPVGSNKTVPFDTRIVSATNRVLSDEITAGRFREDLYYRLNVVQIDLPPLRARGNDVLLLAQVFLERFAERQGLKIKGIAPEAARALTRYPWPGNVRELMNAIERAVALARFDQLQAADLPARVRDHKATTLALETDDPDSIISLDELERRYITQTLRTLGGNKSAVADVLGIDRKTLHRKLKRWQDLDNAANRST